MRYLAGCASGLKRLRNVTIFAEHNNIGEGIRKRVIDPLRSFVLVCLGPYRLSYSLYPGLPGGAFAQGGHPAGRSRQVACCSITTTQFNSRATTTMSSALQGSAK